MSGKDKNHRELGETGVRIFPVGFGAMHLSLSGRPARAGAIRVLEVASSLGPCLIDTADVYCRNMREIGHNERLIGEALRKYRRKEVRVATKGGLLSLHPSEPGVNGTPKYLRAACLRSLSNLATDSIFLYQLHSPDPRVPLEESMGELARLREEGKILHIGLCNVTLTQLKKCLRVCPVSSVQNKFNPIYQGDLKNGLIAFCESRKISYLASKPLGSWRFHGLLSGHPAVVRIARKHGASTHMILLAWTLSKGSRVLPIAGTCVVRHARENARAADLRLRPSELAAIDALTEK